MTHDPVEIAKAARRQASRKTFERGASRLLRDCTEGGVVNVGALSARIAEALMDVVELGYQHGVAAAREDMAHQLEGAFCPADTKGFAPCKGVRLLRQAASGTTPARIG
jgi:hypothetical protein